MSWAGSMSRRCWISPLWPSLPQERSPSTQPSWLAGTVLPPHTILSVISLFYAAFAANPYVALVLKGMQAGVAAVILDVVWGLGANVVKTKSSIHMVVMAAAFIATFVYGVNVIYIILAAGLLGVVLAMLQRKKGGELQ